MSDKIPNLDLIPNSLGHMVLDEEQIVQVKSIRFKHPKLKMI